MNLHKDIFQRRKDFYNIVDNFSMNYKRDCHLRMFNVIWKDDNMRLRFIKFVKDHTDQIDYINNFITQYLKNKTNRYNSNKYQGIIATMFMILSIDELNRIIFKLKI